MIKGDYDLLDRIAKNNVCAEHHTPLTVAWHSGEKCWTLRCGEGHYPDAVTRQLSLTQEFKSGNVIDTNIVNNIYKGQRRRQMQQGKKVIPFTIGEAPGADLGTGELLLPEQVQALQEYALKYHLDIFRSHVVLMYSKPYITLDGYLFYARQSKVDYTLQSRPMTTEELNLYKIGATDHAWIAEVILTQSGARFNGLGIVTYEEMTAKSPRDDTKLRSPVVAAHPWQLAQKRAEWQAMRRAFPIGEVHSITEDSSK